GGDAAGLIARIDEVDAVWRDGDVRGVDEGAIHIGDDTLFAFRRTRGESPYGITLGAFTAIYHHESLSRGKHGTAVVAGSDSHATQRVRDEMLKVRDPSLSGTSGAERHAEDCLVEVRGNEGVAPRIDHHGGWAEGSAKLD